MTDFEASIQRLGRLDLVIYSAFGGRYRFVRLGEQRFWASVIVYRIVSVYKREMSVFKIEKRQLIQLEREKGRVKTSLSNVLIMKEQTASTPSD